MREIVLDTETTGLDPLRGDRIVEIGCVELVNHVASGNIFQSYINPECDMPEGAYRIHGLSTQFLADKPVFAAVVDDFLAFVAEDRLVIPVIPDIFVTGHVHGHFVGNHKGTTMVHSSTWQDQTDFQRMLGFQPKPCILTVVNLHTFATASINFV